MNRDYDICWCGHTRIQHGLLSPELCNHCTDCTGFVYDDKSNGVSFEDIEAQADARLMRKHIDFGRMLR